ncbi:hypothetical protein WA026_023057 [Henosepilachna vigintioctopunctata]|uniref:G-protein coupled receptors family 1 profile domain-containing protein n=1 Tax=Henosepilachna vigintioctopunctata TaxID=420089 RepID=A0AAW1V5D6_9CUCU
MVYSTTVANKHVPKETIYFTQCAPSWENETDTYFTIARMVFSYTFPLLFMSIAYLQIIRVLWRSGQISHQVVDVAGRQSNSFAMNMNTTTEGQLKSRKKAAKMLVAVVIMFAICYFPVHLFSLLRLTVGLKNSETNRALAMISHWLCYANSAVNPIIYNFMSGKYRKEFRRAFEHGCYWGTDKNGGQSSAFYRKNHRTTRTSGTRCHYDDSSQKDAPIKLNY